MDSNISTILMAAQHLQVKIDKLVDQQINLLKVVSDYAQTASDEEVLEIYERVPISYDRVIIRGILKERGLL